MGEDQQHKMPEDDQAFVTLATNDAYTMGSLVVGKCLRRHGTTRKLVVMVSASVSTKARSSLEEVFDEVMLVDVLDSRDKTNLSWLDRPDLGVTFTKLHCWTLTHYTKCVFLDADILVLCNIDELFEREELSASPDAGWPDCFNSGVFVFRPSLDTHSQLMEHTRLHGSFDGGDQGLLNSFFSDWAVKDLTKHLPFVYNLSANALYTYLPAFQKFGHQAKIVHFLGETKPWHLPYNQQLSGEVPASDSQTFDHYVKMWWTEYYSQTDQHRQQSLAKPQTFALPQCQETGWEAQREEETFPSLSLSDLTLKTNGSSSCQQPNERISDTEFVSVSDSTDLKSLESQEDPFDRDEEETGTESDHSTPLPSKDGSDTTEVDSEDDSEDDRLRWEEGRVDYLGKDAFDNIKKQLDRFLD